MRFQMRRSDKKSKSGTPKETDTLGIGQIRQSLKSAAPFPAPQPTPSTPNLFSRSTSAMPLSSAPPRISQPSFLSPQQNSSSPTTPLHSSPKPPITSPFRKPESKEMTALHQVLARLRKVRPIYMPVAKNTLGEEGLKRYRTRLRKKIREVREEKKRVLRECAEIQNEMGLLGNKADVGEQRDSTIVKEKPTDHSTHPDDKVDSTDIIQKCQNLRQLRDLIQSKHEQIAFKEQKIYELRERAVTLSSAYSPASEQQVAELKEQLNGLAKELYQVSGRLRKAGGPSVSLMHRSNIDSRILEQEHRPANPKSRFFTPLKLALLISLVVIAFSLLL